MAGKLLMTWNIRPTREQDYFEFVVREFIPATQKLGLEPQDAWFTVYAKTDQPQIMASFLADNEQIILSALETEEWSSLMNRLEDYVDFLEYKVVPARKGFQL